MLVRYQWKGVWKPPWAEDEAGPEGGLVPIGNGQRGGHAHRPLSCRDIHLQGNVHYRHSLSSIQIFIKSEPGTFFFA